jgi:hypothetical protein
MESWALMRLMSCLAVAVTLSASGCGADADPPPRGTPINDDRIVLALDMRFEGEALIYETASGDECQVIEIAQTPDDVRRLLQTSENAPGSLAKTPDGGAAVEFVGPLGGPPPGACVSAAEADLRDLWERLN